MRPPSAAGLKSTVGANHWADKKLEIMWLAWLEWRLVAGQGLQVSPHDATLWRGGGGRGGHKETKRWRWRMLQQGADIITPTGVLHAIKYAA